jgi:hypothetical protein
MRLARVLLFLALIAVPARANDIPLGDADFTAYIQAKVQLYAPAPVRSIAPFTIAIGKPGEANLVFEFAPLHAQCAAAPESCADKTHDYIQSIVARFPAAGSDAVTAERVPEARPVFLEWLAGELRQRLPTARVEADGMALVVTRPGGKPIRFDQRAYYQLCQGLQFECASALRLSLDRTASWLAPADPAGLRVSLHACASDCGTGADPMAPVVRPAFAGLEEACFKESATAIGPLTNADRIDLNLDAGAAVALCEKNTHALLHPLPPSTAGQVTAVDEPYAAAHALFAEDFPPGPLLIALPSRDMLLMIPADDTVARAALAAKARAAYGAAGSLAISDTLYRRTAAGWEAVTP